MNHDHPHPNSDANLEPDLEARIVAAVLGEASAFESAELDRLLTQRPELVIFKRRIEAVNGLIGSAVRPDQAPMRLAPERRAKLLQAIGGTTTATTPRAAADPVIVRFAEARSNRRRRYIWSSALAACLTFAAILMMNRRSPHQRAVFEQESVARMEMPTSRATELSEVDEEKIELSPFEKRREPAAFSAPSAPRNASNPGRLFGAVHYEKDALPKRDRSASEASQISNGLLDQIDLSQPKAKGVVSFSSTGGSYTSLHDSGSTVGSVTQEFLKDIGAKKSTDKLTFSSDLNGPQINGYYSKRENKDSSAWSATRFGAADEFASEAPVVLSPMEVTAVEERGYTANTTLAGSRIDAKVGSFSVNSAPRFAQTPSGANPTAFAADDDFLSFAKVRASDPGGPILGAELNTPAAIDERLSRENRFAAAAAPPVPAEEDAPQREISAAVEPVSTFSLHVSDVSFRLAQAAFARGETPDPARIRPEEFYNAFDYGDPSPSSNEKVGSRIEQSAHPFLQQRNFVRIATKVASTGRGGSQPLHLTVLLDTSGSMERDDRIGSVRNALQTLGSLLTANDRVTLIGFARQPRLLTEALPGDRAAQLVKLASETPFTGGTNLEEALKLSAELALRHFNPAAQNRIVLITDGAANLGNADPVQLATLIESFRQQSIAFDACGVGIDGLDDSILEALTRKGDGRYYVLDNALDADGEFARQLAGAFRPAAENVKVQVRFNPARVGRYRLIGFEQHRLREEDFRNDQVDAAELAAEEAAVALYQVEVLPEGEGDLGEVFVRFRDPASGGMVERSWPILHEMNPRSFDRASASIQLAGTAALLAEQLRGSEWASGVNLNELAPVANALRGHYAHESRVQQLLGMFEQIRGRSSR